MTQLATHTNVHGNTTLTPWLRLVVVVTSVKVVGRSLVIV